MLPALILGIGAISAGSAQAVGNQSSLSGFGYRLVDLDPADDIDPSFSANWVFNQNTLNFGEQIAGYNFTYTFPADSTIGSKTYVSDAGTSIWSSITPTSYSSYAATSIAGKSGYGQAYSTVDFTLSANTAIVFYGTSTITKSGYAGEQGTLNGNIAVSIYAQNAPFGNPLKEYLYSYYSSIASANNYSETFELTYANTSSSQFLGNLYVEANAGIDVSAVPEPSTYVMMAAGLLISGMAARRRQQRG